MKVLNEVEFQNRILKGSLGTTEFTEGLVASITQDPEFIESQSPPAGSFGAIFWNFVFRDEDVKLLEKVANAIQTAGSVLVAGEATAHAILTAKVSLAISIFKLAKKLGANGAFVTDDELQVLLALRATEGDKGLTVKELAAQINEKSSVIEARLTHLKKYRVHGTTRAFVECVGGHWHLKV